MAKKFVRTTKSVWDAKTDKSQYNDSIVFIEDSKEIWSNNVQYSSKGNKGDKGDAGMNGSFDATYESGVLTLVNDLTVGYYNTEVISVSVDQNVIDLDANKYYSYEGPLDELTITLNEPENLDILNNYMVEFTTGEEGCTVVMPENIKWQNRKSPVIEPECTYQISIINNLATIQMYDYAE